jgi:serine/threonine protein kinase
LSSNSSSKPSKYASRKQLVREKAKRYFQERYDENVSVILSTHTTKFSKKEILPGNLLGKGAFGIVWEIMDIRLDNTNADSSLVILSRADDSYRKFLAQHCKRSSNDHQLYPPQSHQQQQHGQQRYAMKALSKAKDKKLLTQGLVGLAMEASLLSQMKPHPNIIKLRGVADTDPFHEDFFIVIDCLYGTLEDRINEWKSQEQQQQQQRKQQQLKVIALWNALSSQRRIRCQQQQQQQQHEQQQRQMMWGPRYQACHDLASALEHVHQHHIVHRDIKPQNIGFNIRGELTLFDFGLSRPLPLQKDQDGLYQLTGYCGSPRYMAPEVANRNTRYNEQCDVYSFAILAWHILTLQTPYERYTISAMNAAVWQKPFDRPDLTPLQHHDKLQTVLDKAWSHDWKDRPKMQEIRSVFRQEMIFGTDTDDATRLSQSSNMRRHRRRSTFVFSVE